MREKKLRVATLPGGPFHEFWGGGGKFTKKKMQGPFHNLQFPWKFCVKYFLTFPLPFPRVPERTPMKPARFVGKERASNEQIVFELSETS